MARSWLYLINDATSRQIGTCDSQHNRRSLIVGGRSILTSLYISVNRALERKGLLDILNYRHFYLSCGAAGLEFPPRLAADLTRKTFQESSRDVTHKAVPPVSSKRSNTSQEGRYL